MAIKYTVNREKPVDIAQLEKLHEFFNESVGAHRDMSMKLVSLDNGKVELIMPFQEKHSAHCVGGGLHPGALAAAIDSTCGFVIMLNMDTSQAIATINLRLDYIYPSPVGEDVRIYAECYQIHQGFAYVNAYARDISGEKLLCNAVGVFKLGSAGPSLVPEIFKSRD